MSAKSNRATKGRKAAGPPGNPVPPQNKDLTIVALGASAGGIEVLKDLISHLPSDTGMGFVVVQHLDPHHHSVLAELFAKRTSMSVKEAADGMDVLADHIYVIPANTAISISGNTLRLGPREATSGLHLPIDHFMRTLAKEKGHKAVGVVLSGSGSDGTLGIAEIQAHGGVTFAQEESSAKYPSMPRSAISSGCVDYVLTPHGIATELARLARHPYIGQNPASISNEPVEATSPELIAIFQTLRKSTSVDFTHYRQSTIVRRINRRMVVHKIDSMQEYVRYLKGNAPEIRALHQDILIKVTSFFRDPAVFDILGTTVFQPF